MARIPSIQRRVSLPTTTGIPVAPIVPINDKKGEGLEQAGKVIEQIGVNQLRAKSDAMVTQSFVNATLKIDELKSSIDTNKTLSWEQNDLNAVPPTADPLDVKARLNQIYETAAEGLSVDGVEKFTKDFSMLSAKGEIEIRREQVARDNAQLEAHTIAVLDTLSKGALADGTEAVWVASLQKGIDSIDSLEVNRQIGPKKAEKLRQKFKTSMDKIKNDNLAVDVVNAVAKGIRNVDLDEEEQDAQDRLNLVDSRIEIAVKNGAISRQAGAKIRLDFLSRVDDAMAHQQVEEDAAKFLIREKDSGYLPNLNSKQRSIYAKRARSILEAKDRKFKTENNAKQRVFLKNAQTVIDAISTGANIAPEIRNLVSPQSIDANIQDPAIRERLKLLVTDAQEFAPILLSIAGKSPDEIAVIEQKLIGDVEGVRSTVAEASLAEQDTRQLATFQRAKVADANSRKNDPVQYLINNNEAVSEAFQTYTRSLIQTPNDSDVHSITYATFESTRDEAYAAMKFPLSMRPRLPETFIKEQVAFARKKGPEEVASMFSAMSSVMGNDFNSILSEMTKAGLPKTLGFLTVVNDPLSQQTIANIAKLDGGVAEFKKNISTEIKTDVTAGISNELQELRDVAGINNIGMYNTIFGATELLALSFIKDDNVVTAIDSALKIVVNDNYQILNLAKLKGVVPKDSVANPQMTQFGLMKWLQDNENLDTINFESVAPGANVETARQGLKESAQWTLTPDGNAAELRSFSGTPVEDKNGNPLIVPLANLQQTITGERGPGVRGGAIMFERLSQNSVD